MAPSQLPLDVLVCILSHLPSQRTRADLSARTIARFSSCSRLFHDAASHPTLWEPHYIARFCHYHVSREEERVIQFNNDWRLMYVARKRLERKALDTLQRLIEERKTRRHSVKDLIDLSCDVWDVLSLEKDAPFPPSFLDKSEWGLDHGKVPQRPLNWRYWSEQALAIISRTYAICELQRVKELEGTEEPILFEQAMAVLSCFFSVLSGEVIGLLDDLTDVCEEYLETLGTVLDSDQTGFNPTQVCKDICICLAGNGFRLPQSRNFRELMNHFPHTYLTTNRRTIPISMVHIFTYVAQCLTDLEVSPVVFPNTVLARVDIEGLPNDSFFLVNPCSPVPEEFILAPPFNFVPPVPPETTVPAATPSMLVRAAKNIVASLQDRNPPSPEASHSAFFCALTIIFLFEPDDRHTLFLLSAGQLPPIECYTLSVALSPLLDETRHGYLENYCQKGLVQERREAFTPPDKHHTEISVQYYVGMVFRHRKHEYYGCIIGWDECYDYPEETNTFFVDNTELTKGFDQPFYRAYQCETNIIRYAAQEHLQIIPLTPELARNFLTYTPDLSRYFCDILIGDRGNDRGVFKLSTEATQCYPDDDWYGTRWVQEGGEAASAQLAAVEEFTRQFKDLL